jgi:hypothetical protein
MKYPPAATTDTPLKWTFTGSEMCVVVDAATRETESKVQFSIVMSIASRDAIVDDCVKTTVGCGFASALMTSLSLKIRGDSSRAALMFVSVMTMRWPDHANGADDSAGRSTAHDNLAGAAPRNSRVIAVPSSNRNSADRSLRTSRCSASCGSADGFWAAQPVSQRKRTR